MGRRRVFDHVTIHVADRAASAAFYATVLATLGIEQTHDADWLAEWDDFSVSPADGEHPPTRGLHVGFAARSRAEVVEFWRAGTGAGYRDDGPPGPRHYTEDYYGAFLLDPDGNSAEAVHDPGRPVSGHIDHLWIRVQDVGAAKSFYETVAPHAGLRLGDDCAERVQFQGDGGSFSLVRGTPTEYAHLAFPAHENAAVDSFHRAVTQAGYRDNGAPGERAVYHPGYYAAFVLDPDGNNVEVVCHNRGDDGRQAD
jgi:catechol 2,3-dioxygenase-like lactoylglutathione lyase family enzyme